MPQPLGIVVLSDVGMQKPKNEIVESFSSLLEEVNLKLDDYEKVNNLVIINEKWTVENKLLTPTMKIKRNLIEKKYLMNYEKWYNKEKIFFVN